MNQDEAAAAIAGVNRTRSRLAGRSHWPLWRHAAFGAVEAVIVFGISLPLPWMGVLTVLGLVGVVMIARDDRARYGMFVSGWQKSGLPATLAIVALLFACCALSLLGRGDPVPAPASLAATAIAFVGCTLGSLWWERLYRAHLSAGPAR